MNETNPTPTQPETLLPCPLYGHLPDKGEFTNGPYIAVSGAPNMPKFYAIVCPGCCSTAYDENKERVVKKWNTRAAVTAPRGDVATTARNRDVAQRVVMSTEGVLGERFDIATRHELADRITAALDAATSSPAPAESDDAHRCPHCRRLMRSDFDEDVGMWYECDNCDYREQVSSGVAAAPADNDAESVALIIPTCGDCPFVDHSGAFTPGGAKDICGHKDAADHFAPFVGPGNEIEHYHWKHRTVNRNTAPPAQCPLRATTTTKEDR